MRLYSPAKFASWKPTGARLAFVGGQAGTGRVPGRRIDRRRVENAEGEAGQR